MADMILIMQQFTSAMKMRLIWGLLKLKLPKQGTDLPNTIECGNGPAQLENAWGFLLPAFVDRYLVSFTVCSFVKVMDDAEG